jgi:hypothetical protein
MAAYVFNVAKGRGCELFYRVKNNDPAASAIVLIPLAVSDTEGNRQDDPDVGTFLAAAPNEAGASWGRKVLTDASTPAIGAIAPDYVNNRYACPLPSVTWTTPTAAQNTVALLVAYDADTAGGTDADLIPICVCDFAVTADGNDVILNAGDCLRAS